MIQYDHHENKIILNIANKKQFIINNRNKR